MDRCRCSEYKAAVNKIKFYIPGTYIPSYVDKYDATGFTACWIRHKMQVPFDTFQEARAWHSSPAADELSPDARLYEHMWCGEMSKFKGTRYPEPATGLKQLKANEEKREAKKNLLGDKTCVYE